MSKEIIIFGNSVFAEVMSHYIEVDSKYDVVAYTADSRYISNRTFLSKPLIPFEDISNEYNPSDYYMFVAVGYRNNNLTRAQKCDEARSEGYTLMNYIHSSNEIYDGTKIGDNCFIFENQTIQPGVSIGDNVIIWSGNHIGHHSVIKDHCFIASHVVISGSVEIGPYSFLGVNSTISDGIDVAERSVIGAGAVVINDTDRNNTYVGNPAESIDS